MERLTDEEIKHIQDQNACGFSSEYIPRLLAEVKALRAIYKHAKEYINNDDQWKCEPYNFNLGSAIDYYEGLINEPIEFKTYEEFKKWEKE